MVLMPSTWNSDGTTNHQALYSDSYVNYSSTNIGYSGGIVYNTSNYIPIAIEPSSFTPINITPSTWSEA